MIRVGSFVPVMLWSIVLVHPSHLLAEADRGRASTLYYPLDNLRIDSVRSSEYQLRTGTMFRRWGKTVGTITDDAWHLAVPLVSSPAKHVIAVRGGGYNLANLVDWLSSTKLRCWLVLLASITIESFATSLSKVARDSSSLQVFLGACTLYLSSMCGFAICLAKIEVGIAYAAWAALGTAFVTVSGILFFQEDCDAVKVACLFMILAGVVGLNLRDSH